ncbi:MAG TPA: hypothetical protein VIZ17_05500 [Acetobacteraceae bacterium]
MAQITSAVGNGAPNLPENVRAIQMLLNRFQAVSASLLAVDGLIGPQTLGALRSFFTAHLPADTPTDIVQPDSSAITTLNGGDTNRIAWGGKVDPSFKEKVIQISLALEVSVDFLMSAMAFESGETFSPSILNAAGSGATGLIQFMPATAQGLGTTTADLAAMSATEQLDFVQLYFQPFTGRLSTLTDVYMAILFPVAVGKGPNFVLFRAGTIAYDQNAGLDTNGDGLITASEAAAHVRQKYNKGLTPGLLA